MAYFSIIDWEEKDVVKHLQSGKKLTQEQLDEWCSGYKNEQAYDDGYWPITQAYTRFVEGKFVTCLKTVKEFIDKEMKNKKYDEDDYKKLQKELQVELDITMPSVRKAINQTVKLGFVGYHLESYHKDLEDYLTADETTRKQLLSSIVFDKACLRRSVSKDENGNEIRFLYKTLQHIKTLCHDEIVGLMLIAEPEKYTDGFITKPELDKFVRESKEEKFIISNQRKFKKIGTWEEKKYNQVFLRKIQQMNLKILM